MAANKSLLRRLRNFVRLLRSYVGLHVESITDDAAHECLVKVNEAAETLLKWQSLPQKMRLSDEYLDQAERALYLLEEEREYQFVMRESPPIAA